MSDKICVISGLNRDLKRHILAVCNIIKFTGQGWAKYHNFSVTQS